MGYALPSYTDFVSSSWQDHKNRNPPSGEPGTDYACGYGSQIVAVDDGSVLYVKRDNGGGTGRYVEYRMDDGRTTRSLHLSQVLVNPGQRITRGQVIGISGASGYGSDWYYGPHVHQTLWPGDAWAANTIDFALYVGGITPQPTLEEMGDEVFIAVVNGDWWLVVPQGDGKPMAAILGGDSQGADSGLPVLYFNWADSIAQLQRAVSFP